MDYDTSNTVPDGVADAAGYITQALEENIEDEGIALETAEFFYKSRRLDDTDEPAGLQRDNIALLEAAEDFGSAVDYLENEGLVETYEDPETGKTIIDYDFDTAEDADARDEVANLEESLETAPDNAQVYRERDSTDATAEANGHEPIGDGPFDDPLQRPGEVWEQSAETDTPYREG